MKKVFLSAMILIALSASSNAQSKKSKPVVKDTVEVAPTPVITDSTALFSYKDYTKFYEAIVAKLPTEQGVTIIRYWDALLNERVAEWKKINKVQ